MKVVVTNIYSEVTNTIEGSSDKVLHELTRLYPWLNRANPEHRGDIPTMVSRLNRDQAFHARVVDYKPTPIQKTEPNLHGDEAHVVQAMLGYNHTLQSAFEAAKFLCGGQPRSLDEVRQAFYHADGNPEEAALLAYGLEASPANLKALRAVQAMSGVHKSAQEPVQAGSVEAGHPDADNATDEIRRAFQDQFVLPVELGGKHSQGSMLARDQDTGNVWLLKPGSGGQTPAAGAKEDPSSQSRREAAFYHVAEDWHLNDYIPESELIIIDGREYAAIKLLPWSYKTMDKIKGENEGTVRHLLHTYLHDGLLHRWGVLDFVLGNPDRHAQNLMVRENDIKLIDHGSAMAGEGFDPAHDQYSFTPYYLRAWASGKFSALTPEDKLKAMPRLGAESEERLRAWIDGLHASDLDRVLLRYGVSPGPAKERLAKIKLALTQDPADLAINKLWVQT